MSVVAAKPCLTYSSRVATSSVKANRGVSVRAQPARAAPVLVSSLNGQWHTSVESRAATDLSQFQRQMTASGTASRQVTRMGNPNTNGPFAPLVRLARLILGKKRLNSIRGQAISYHSQVIRSFCSRIGADNKQIQGLIKKAKKNGEKLGFLA